MASYWRYMSANYQHGYSTYKELDLDCFETSEDKVAYLLERCQLQEKDRKSLLEEVSHLEDKLEMRNLENRQLKKNKYELEIENGELKYQCNQLEKKAQKLLMQVKDNQFENGGGGEKDGNLLSSVRRGDYLVRHTSQTGNPSGGNVKAGRRSRLIPEARASTSEVSNEGDLKAQLEETKAMLKFEKDKADYLDTFIVRKLALAEQLSQQTNEVPMAEGVAHGVTAARVLPEVSPPAAFNNNATSSMNGNAAAAGVRRVVDEDEGDQVVPTG